VKNKTRASIERFLPLTVKEVEFVDPTILLRGDGWWISITCPWQLSKSGVPIVAWESKDIEDQIWELVGHQITSVRPQSLEHPGIANFDIDGGLVLQITADTDLDPWVIRLPDVTIVGSTSFEV
jgi:hypothetical protein